MSRNGSGTYTLPSGNPVVTGTTISSAWANNTLTDIATALSGSIAADGQTPITGALIGTSGTVAFGGTGQTQIPSGTTAQRSASPSSGMIRLNTDTKSYEGYNGTAWSSINAIVSVKDYGALGDNSTDDTAAIQAAITAINAAGGGIVFFPKGTYICSSTIAMAKYVTLQGEGPVSSILKWATTGDGIKMTSAINSSVAVYTSVNNLGLTCTNASNTGAGYDDVGGTFVNLTNVAVTGFKYGVIFDQTELAYIDLCYFNTQLTAGVWLVNGSDHTPGASGLFTNRIGITRCQFNQNPTQYCILDDGGYSHSFDNNNYNGGLTHIRAAGATPLNISNSEFESAASTQIVLTSTALSGTGVGQCSNVTIQNNIIVPTTGQSCIDGASVGSLVCIDNFYGNSSAAKVIGAAIANYVDIAGVSGGGGVIFNGTATNQFSTNNTGTFTPVLTIGGATTGITYTTQVGTYTRLGNIVNFNIYIILSSKGSLTGGVTITGLPFASTSTQTFQDVTFATGIVGLTSLGVAVNPSATSIALYDSKVNYGGTLQNTQISNTTQIAIQGFYFAQ